MVGGMALQCACVHEGWPSPPTLRVSALARDTAMSGLVVNLKCAYRIYLEEGPMMRLTYGRNGPVVSECCRFSRGT